MFSKRIGIIGGGQLAKMMVMEANKLGFDTIVYCAQSNEPAAKISQHILDLSIYSPKLDNINLPKLNDFISKSDVITFEFENINLNIAKYIENHNKTLLLPSSDVLRVCQNRELENSFLKKLKIPVADFLVYANYQQMILDLNKIKDKIGFPLRIKTSRFGYDGKGQIIIANTNQMQTNKKKIISLFNFGETQQNVVVEKEIKIKNELSIIIARNIKGQEFSLSPTLTFHQNSILRKTLSPYTEDKKVVEKANKFASLIAKELKVVGLIAIEMFITSDNRVVVNELSPRPHNSGHWSLNAKCLSQFELLLRAITGLNFPDQNKQIYCDDKTVYEMVNLLGKDILDLEKYLKMSNAFIYNYSKDQISEGRKMGHVNIVHTSGIKSLSTKIDQR